jgi:hypothetical protein
MFPKWLMVVGFCVGTFIVYGFVDKLLYIPIVAMLPYILFLVLAVWGAHYYIRNFHIEWLLTGPAILLLISIIISLSVRQYSIWEAQAVVEKLYQASEDFWNKTPPFDDKMHVKLLVPKYINEVPVPPFGGEYLTPARGKIGFEVPGGLWRHTMWYDGKTWTYEN